MGVTVITPRSAHAFGGMRRYPSSVPSGHGAPLSTCRATAAWTAATKRSRTMSYSSRSPLRLEPEEYNLVMPPRAAGAPGAMA